MKRFFLALAFYAGLLIGAYAQVGLPFPGPGMPAAAGGGGCSQATTFLARTSGLSGTETTAYTTMICGMVTDGTWTLFDALYILATNNSTTAALNLVSTSFTAATVGGGTFTFTADQGIAFNTGGNASFNTGLAPNAGTNCTQNSCSIGIYDRTDVTACAVMGSGTTSYIYMIPHTGGGTFEYTVNDTSFASPANASAIGQWIASRSSSTTTVIYKKSSSTAFSTNSATSGAPNANSMYIGSRNDTGTLASVCTNQLSAAYITAGLTSTQAANIMTRINAFMTALGANVY